MITMNNHGYNSIKEYNFQLNFVKNSENLMYLFRLWIHHSFSNITYNKIETKFSRCINLIIKLQRNPEEYWTYLQMNRLILLAYVTLTLSSQLITSSAKQTINWRKFVQASNRTVRRLFHIRNLTKRNLRKAEKNGCNLKQPFEHNENVQMNSR